jgi:putative membrane protein
MGLKRIFIMILTLVPFSIIDCAPALYNGPNGNWGHMMGYGYGGGFMWLIVLVLVGVVIYFLLQSAKSKSADGPAAETPLDILKKRYAKGEINKEEFEQKKKDLGY